VVVRYEELTGRSFRVCYGDASLAGPVREVQIPPGAAKQGPKDDVMGHLFAEGILTSLLA